jgi:tetratricopeptide (TPR) repeat protein
MLAAIGICTLTAGVAAARTTQTPGPKAARPASSGARPASANAAQFDELVKQADAARNAEQWDKAIELYGKAVKLKPSYTEGIWYQGVAYYSLDQFTECRDAFRRVTRAAPKNAPALAFLGLCEFGLRDYDRALQHLAGARALGIPDKELVGVARYHAAILMTRSEQFDQAMQTLGEFSSEGNDSPRVIEAMGIATLHMPMLPNEVPPERREMVLMAGRRRRRRRRSRASWRGIRRRPTCTMPTGCTS